MKATGQYMTHSLNFKDATFEIVDATTLRTCMTGTQTTFFDSTNFGKILYP